MASTNFSYGTIITSIWLNDVNTAVYTTIPTLAPRISPTFTTPNLGVATATSINRNGFSTPATGCTWALADGKTLTVSNTLTLSGTDGASLSIGSAGSTVSGANTGDQLVFKNFTFSGNTVIPTTTTDTLQFLAGTGVSFGISGKQVTINASASAMTLLFSGSYGAVSAINFSNVFNPSLYSKYLIQLTDLSPATNDSPYLRFYTSSGVSSTNYFQTQPANSSVSGTVTSSGLGFFTLTDGLTFGGSNNNLDIEISVGNTQTTLMSSGIFYFAASAGATTNTINGTLHLGMWTGTSPTGFTIFLGGGSTISTNIKIFGIRNS